MQNVFLFNDLKLEQFDRTYSPLTKTYGMKYIRKKRSVDPLAVAKYMAKCAYAPTLCQYKFIRWCGLFIFVPHKRMNWKHVNHLKFLFCILNSKYMRLTIFAIRIPFRCKEFWIFFCWKDTIYSKSYFWKLTEHCRYANANVNRKKKFNLSIIHTSM